MLLTRTARLVAAVGRRAALTAAPSSSSSSPPISLRPLAPQPPILTPTRGFRTSGIVAMGRRSAKIATRKGAQDMKRAKVYGKLGKLILQAAKAGGPDPVANSRLRDALAVAKQANCPKEIIDRNIKKAADKSQADFSEIMYEAYGPGGTGLLISALTDSPNRAAGDVRTVFAKSKGAGAKLAESGSVSFGFNKVGVVVLEASPDLDEDAVLAAAADAGAEDAAPAAGGRWRVTAAPSDFGTVRDALVEAGLPVAADASGLEYVPNTLVKLSDEDLEANEALIEKLLALDDVDAVYCSGEGVMEETDEE